MPAGPARLGAVVAVAAAALDQLTKAAMAAWVTAHGGPIAVLPFANIVLVHNRGVSFGMFSDAPGWGRWVLVLVGVAIVAGLLLWLRRVTAPALAAALGLVVGGALGNLADRILLGAVVDFLDLHAGGWHWPAFNLADTAICLGAAYLILTSLIGTGGDRRLPDEPGGGSEADPR